MANEGSPVEEPLSSSLSSERVEQWELLGSLGGAITEASNLCQQIAILTYEFRDNEGEDLRQLQNHLDDYGQKLVAISRLAKSTSLKGITVPESLLRHIDEGGEPVTWLRDALVELKQINEVSHGQSIELATLRNQLRQYNKDN